MNHSHNPYSNQQHSDITLSDMMKQHPQFKELPLDKQDIFLVMAMHFTKDEKYLQCTADELCNKLEIGHRHQWWEFLDLEPVENYIELQQKRLRKIATRRSFAQLEREASAGDVAAAREVMRLSGQFEKQDARPVIILHHVPRPQNTTPPPKVSVKE